MAKFDMMNNDGNSVPTLDEIHNFIGSANNPELKTSEMVTMIWEDGKITATKGNDLFLQRSFHCDLRNMSLGEFAFRMPEKYGDFCYAIVTNEDAITIRNMMKKYINLKTIY